MPGYRIDRQLTQFGERLHAWRMVLNLTAEQVSDRAGISPGTLRSIERGAASVSFGSVMQVARALGVLDEIVSAVDPLTTDVGRARAGALSRRRARS